MMKRTGVPRLAPDEPAPLPQSPAQMQQAGASNMHTLAQSAQPQILGPAAMLSVGGYARGARPAGPAPPVINYMKAGVQYPKQPPQPQQPPLRHKLVPAPVAPQLPLATAGPGPGASPPGAPPAAPPGAQFQRLKVEDALSYLDLVKYKFNTQPQVYNDFLDIMKEFKSQTIDTPGVITRVSNLFKGHPELIVGFNTFLPPGYKIEVQSNGQVSVSMPSPTGLGGGVLLGVGGPGVGPQPAHHPPAQLVHLLPVAQSVSNAIVHNLSVSATPANTLHHISQAHQQIEAAIHHAPGTVAPPAGSGPHAAPAPPGQPVEFNHAIEYVNKIKSRFSRQPDKYKRFLEILHAYQRGHRDVKEPQAKQQTEQEVYSQVAKLFENQDDLLAEFGQFLPDAKAVTKPHYPPHPRTPPLMPPQQRPEPEPERFLPAPAPSPPHAAPPQHLLPQVPKHTSTVSSSAPPPQHLKRSPSFTSSTQMPVGLPPPKKSRLSSLTGIMVRDVSYAEAAKYGTQQEYNFFDRARRALRSQEVYDNFLRCLLLFTNEIISSSELVSVTSPFLCRHPELHKWLQDFVGPVSPPSTPTQPTPGYNNSYGMSSNSLLGFERERLDRERSLDNKASVRYEPIGPLGAQLRHDRPQGDAALDIDLSTCKRLGTSYCALPREAAARRCSGRTPLCKEVLNDTWVSFPTWSEDSTFVTSRKTQYEEYIYRCEDERFELDVVIETNAATIRVLEGVQKKLSRMTAEDAAKYRLDDGLGGHSATIHQRALRRIYGEKVAVDIIAGLKKNPVVAVPVVLRRLKAKEEEWREAQKGFNKQWREQNEKYYLKSLDHQGITFKQNDLKAMRSKSLYNEVESAYAARKPGPHLVHDYHMKNRQEAIKVVRDAAELLIHHARRQTGIQKAEKRRIKQLLRHFLPDLFAHPRQPLSDDERDEEEKEEPSSPAGSPTAETAAEDKAVKQEKQESSESDNASDKSSRHHKNDKENKPKNNNHEPRGDKLEPKDEDDLRDHPPNPESCESQEAKDEEDLRDHPPNEARFVCTMSWYIFLRLHGVLCQRLGALRRAALQLAEREARERAQRRPSVAAALRLKPNNLPADASSPADYYPALLELVRGVLDGNTEATAYEDAAREMFGIHAYPAYTLDKLVWNAVRQLQRCVSEPWSLRAAELAARGGMRGALSYVRRAQRFLHKDHTAFLIKLYGGDECRVSFELLESGGEGRASPNNDTSRLSPTNQSRGSGPHGSPVSRLAAWSLYTERYARPDHAPSANKPVFLARNAARCGGASAGPGDNVAPGAGAKGGARGKRKPHRIVDRSECTLSSGISYSVPSANKPVFLARNAARCGGASAGPGDNVAPGAGAKGGARGKRKPHRIVDRSECTLSSGIRLVASRPHHLYRSGALAAARASHARLHAARRSKFKAWLQENAYR
ncbi:paired amphipathic helix protein Sin3b [Cydia amplana]|uniref:paired amphipathic helix protein Sin3b n=1 Tax=Cydia amplana TaxID=1869771 RepID=UPI002FE5B5F7